VQIALVGGRYRLEAMLAEGGMGEVWAASDTQTNARVAVKRLHRTRAQDRELVHRFQREARVVAALRSPHVARVLDAGWDDAGPFIVMELLVGEDLDATLARERRLAPDLAMRIIVHACTGLEAAHAAGIVHRDVKSSNLFVAENDASTRVVKLVDFGIAKLTTTERATKVQKLTRTGEVFGSPAYMSPEQLRGADAVDARTDLWSLGVVLFEMLTGQLPFRGEGVLALMRAIAEDPIPDARDLVPDLPSGIVAVLYRALQRDPADRYTSAREMRLAVEVLSGPGAPIDASLFIAQQRDSALPETRPADDTMMDAVPAPTTSRRMAARFGSYVVEGDRVLAPAPPPPAIAQRRVRWWIAIVALALVLAILIAMMLR
jgi:serine/threonine-protein kinase